MNNTVYLKSEALELNIKLDRSTGIITVKDPIPSSLRKSAYVEYSSEECEIIKENMGEIDQTVHRVKKHFDGIIIKCIDAGKNPLITETGIIEPTQGDLF